MLILMTGIASSAPVSVIPVLIQTIVFGMPFPVYIAQTATRQDIALGVYINERTF